MKCVSLVLFLLSSSFSYGAHLPSNFKMCHKSDPKFEDCLKLAIQDAIIKLATGNKELGVHPLEPFQVKVIDIEGAKTGSVALDQKYENVELFDTTVATIHKVDLDLENCIWKFDIVTDHVLMKADYTLKGQILVFPINGHGKCEVDMYNVHNKHEIKCERVTKKGKTYFKAIDYKFAMDPEKIHYNFMDIIPGSEQVSKEIVKTINENGLAIFKDIKSGFEKVFSELYKSTMNSVFSKVPESEIFLD